MSSTIGRVLVLRNSVNGAASFSDKGINKAISVLEAASPSVSIVERDLVDSPVPMLNKATCAAIRNGILETDEQKAADKLATELIDEIKSVDVMVVGLPRYNFGVPASFKTYLDYVGRPRITFRYGPNGPEGLLPDIPVWCMMSTGGPYGDDYYNEWLRTVMPFLGLKDLTFFPIGGVGMGKGDESIANLDPLFAKALENFKKNSKL